MNLFELSDADLRINLGCVELRVTEQLLDEADIRNLSSGLAATRQALDPEQLGKNVSKNIDSFLGKQVGNLAETVKANLDIADQNIETANNGLRNIASRIEAHAERSKWDFAVLAAGMAIAAILAGGGTVYFTKQQLDTANFQDAIGLIRNDDDAYWCKHAQASIIQDAGGKPFCAVSMPKYQIEEEE